MRYLAGGYATSSSVRFASIFDLFARRFQVQERLTEQSR